MSQSSARSLESHWNAFAERIGLPTLKVVSTDYLGEEAIYVEFNLGQMTAAFDSAEQRHELMARYDLAELEILEASPGVGRMFVGWVK